MKKTRLLEIIREEIASALSETSYAGKNAIPDMKKDPAYGTLSSTGKMDAEKELKTGGTVELEEDQLNEIEQLAEMASIVQLKNQLEKQGKTGELEAVKAAEKATIDKLKQNPVFSGEGKNARLKGYVSALKKELKSEHDINLQDLLTTVMLDAEKVGDKFKDDIATNTIEKDAAAQVLGTEKGQRGRKATEKPAEEKPAKVEKTVKTEPKSTESSDDEAPSGDVEVEKAARNRDELIKQYKSEVEPYLKDKIAAKDMEWLKSKQDIIKKYNQAKQVNV